MTWTAPPTWVVQDVLTASQMNTYVRDNETHIYDRWGTTAPHCSVYYAAGTQALAANTVTTLAYDTAQQNTPAGSPMWNSGLSTTNIVANLPGRYIGVGTAEFNDAVGGDRQLRVQIVATLVAVVTLAERSAAQTTNLQVVGGPWRMAVNDYFQFRAMSTVATSLTNQPHYGAAFKATMLGE